MLTFLGILTLQVGLIALATSFFTIVVCTMLTNMLTISPESLSWIVVIIFCISCLIDWILVFSGAINDGLKQLNVAYIMWTILICVWVALVILSTLQFGIRIVCIENRCPESMWLVDNSRPYDNDAGNGQSIIDNHNTTTSQSVSTKDDTSSTADELTMKHVYDTLKMQAYQGAQDSVKKNENENEHHHYKNASKTRHSPMATRKARNMTSTIIMSVLIFLFFFGYFAYAWAILRSYKKCMHVRNGSQANGNFDPSAGC